MSRLEANLSLDLFTSFPSQAQFITELFSKVKNVGVRSTFTSLTVPEAGCWKTRTAQERNGTEWNGTEWNGTEWNGTEWNGTGSKIWTRFSVLGAVYTETRKTPRHAIQL